MFYGYFRIKKIQGIKPLETILSHFQTSQNLVSRIVNNLNISQTSKNRVPRLLHNRNCSNQSEPFSRLPYNLKIAQTSKIPTHGSFTMINLSNQQESCFTSNLQSKKNTLKYLNEVGPRRGRHRRVRDDAVLRILLLFKIFKYLKVR